MQFRIFVPWRVAYNRMEEIDEKSTQNVEMQNDEIWTMQKKYEVSIIFQIPWTQKQTINVSNC